MLCVSSEPLRGYVGGLVIVMNHDLSEYRKGGETRRKTNQKSRRKPLEILHATRKVRCKAN